MTSHTIAIVFRPITISIQTINSWPIGTLRPPLAFLLYYIPVVLYCCNLEVWPPRTRPMFYQSLAINPLYNPHHYRFTPPPPRAVPAFPTPPQTPISSVRGRDVNVCIQPFPQLHFSLFLMYAVLVLAALFAAHCSTPINVLYTMRTWS